jgi:hypothetical protein
LKNIGSSLLLFPAAPFALGAMMQDNYQYIQDVRHFLKENRNKRENAMNKYKDIR